MSLLRRRGIAAAATGAVPEPAPPVTEDSVIGYARQLADLVGVPQPDPITADSALSYARTIAGGP